MDHLQLPLHLCQAAVGFFTYLFVIVFLPSLEKRVAVVIGRCLLCVFRGLYLVILSAPSIVFHKHLIKSDQMLRSVGSFDFPVEGPS